MDLDNWMLFDLANDPTEIHDLAATQPEVLKRLVADLHQELQREQGHAQVAQRLDHAVECGLVDDRPADDRGAVVFVDEGHAVEPSRPPRSEVPADADLVLVDGLAVSGRLPARSLVGAVVCAHEGERTNGPGERTSPHLVIVVVVAVDDRGRPGQRPSSPARVTASRRLVAPSFV